MAASVSNSLIADGCVIEGEVDNSVLFRGVHVGKGTVVENCVILQDSVIRAELPAELCDCRQKCDLIKNDRSLFRL